MPFRLSPSCLCSTPPSVLLPSQAAFPLVMANGPHQLQVYFLPQQICLPLLAQIGSCASPPVTVPGGTKHTDWPGWVPAGLGLLKGIVVCWVCTQDGLVLFPLQGPPAAWLTLSHHLPIWYSAHKALVSKEGIDLVLPATCQVPLTSF